MHLSGRSSAVLIDSSITNCTANNGGAVPTPFEDWTGEPNRLRPPMSVLFWTTSLAREPPPPRHPFRLIPPLLLERIVSPNPTPR